MRSFFEPEFCKFFDIVLRLFYRPNACTPNKQDYSQLAVFKTGLQKEHWPGKFISFINNFSKTS